LAREDPSGGNGDKSPTISKELSGCAAAKADELATGREMPPEAGRHPEPAGEQWDFDHEGENRRRLPRLAEKYLRR